MTKQDTKEQANKSADQHHVGQKQVIILTRQQETTFAARPMTTERRVYVTTWKRRLFSTK